MTKIEKINLLQEQLSALFPQKKWNDKFLEKVKVDFTFQSNKLENNALSYGQTIRYLKEAVQPRNASVKDCLDMKNHYEILDSIFTSYSSPLSVNTILQLHKRLMKNMLQWQEDAIYSPGKYKTGFNYTTQSTGKLITYLPPDLVAGEMKKLVSQTNKKLPAAGSRSEENHPLAVAAWFHNRFMEIHPFEDGNGRIGRIFMNQILLKKGFAPIFITPISRKQYLKLFEISDSSNLKPMQDFFADLLIESMKAKKAFILQQKKKTILIKHWM